MAIAEHAGDPGELERHRGLPADAWDPEWYRDHCLPASLAREVEAALHGGCYPMAVALHRRTGWKLAVLFDEFDGSSIHAFVIDESGNFVDAAGYRTLEDLSSVYPVDIPVVVDADLDLMRQFSGLLTEEQIELAGNLLDRLPCHPWRRAGAEI